jgi:hypothetical protein
VLSGRCIDDDTHTDDTDAETGDLNPFISVSSAKQETDRNSKYAKSNSLGIGVAIEIWYSVSFSALEKVGLKEEGLLSTVQSETT